MVHHEPFKKYLANYNNKKAISNNTFKDKKVGENVKFLIRAILNTRNSCGGLGPFGPNSASVKQ